MGAAQEDGAVVVGVAPPAALAHSAGEHTEPPTLAARPQHHLRVLKLAVRLGLSCLLYLERFQSLSELPGLVQSFNRVSVLKKVIKVKQL